MKAFIVLSALVLSSVSQAATCDVEVAKNYVAGIELVASGVSGGRIETGDKVNGKTITKSDIKAVAADSAFLITVTNTAESYYNKGNYSKYIVTLKQVGNTCFPASIVLVGNTSQK
jgi:hypothetical protein